MLVVRCPEYRRTSGTLRPASNSRRTASARILAGSASATPSGFRKTSPMQAKRVARHREHTRVGTAREVDENSYGLDESGTVRSYPLFVSRTLTVRVRRQTSSQRSAIISPRLIPVSNAVNTTGLRYHGAPASSARASFAPSPSRSRRSRPRPGPGSEMLLTGLSNASPHSRRAISKQCCSIASSRRTVAGLTVFNLRSRNSAMSGPDTLPSGTAANPTFASLRSRYRSGPAPRFVGVTVASYLRSRLLHG